MRVRLSELSDFPSHFRSGSPTFFPRPTLFAVTFLPPANEPPSPELSRWFAEEVIPHEEALRNWLRARFPNLPDRDDLIQDVYIRLWKARSQAPIDCPKAFLFTAARNLALNRLRHAYYEPNLGESFRSTVLDEKPDIPSQVSRREDYTRLTEAIQSLPERCREVFVLRRLYGYSQKEIAARLGIAEKTVEIHAMVGMKKLTQYFRDLEASAPAADSRAPVLRPSHV